MQYPAGPKHKLKDTHVVGEAALGCGCRSFASALVSAFVSDHPSHVLCHLCSVGALQLSEKNAKYYIERAASASVRRSKETLGAK